MDGLKFFGGVLSWKVNSEEQLMFVFFIVRNGKSAVLGH